MFGVRLLYATTNKQLIFNHQSNTLTQVEKMAMAIAAIGSPRNHKWPMGNRSHRSHFFWRERTYVGVCELWVGVCGLWVRGYESEFMWVSVWDAAHTAADILVSESEFVILNMVVCVFRIVCVYFFTIELYSHSTSEIKYICHKKKLHFIVHETRYNQ